MDNNDALRALLVEGIEAMLLTRDYVGAETLPAIEGWAWWDWTEKARAALSEPADEPVHEHVWSEFRTGEDGGTVTVCVNRCPEPADEKPELTWVPDTSGTHDPRYGKPGLVPDMKPASKDTQ